MVSYGAGLLVPVARPCAPDSMCHDRAALNLSDHCRAIPQSQYVPVWFNPGFVRSLPRPIYDRLSPAGRHACRAIVTSAADDAGTAVYFRHNEGPLDEFACSGSGATWLGWQTVPSACKL